MGRLRVKSDAKRGGAAGRLSAPVSLAVLVLLLVLGVLPGCTRRFFRNCADKEVQEVMWEKDPNNEWRLDEYYVYPSPMARFADLTNPDKPPMPPDDPAAWWLSPKPQKPKEVAYLEGAGYLETLANWDAENRARLKPETAKPDVTPASACESDLRRPSRPYLITFDQAVELAVFNSREFQNVREDLYLAALPVTLERFAFAPQFEATNETIREWAGKKHPVGPRNRWVSNTNLGVSKLFTTGALLMLQLANETIINLTGPDKHTISQSTLILDFAQPLLRGGGRAVTLEPLTQTERELLYELRDYARFHRDFFVGIAAGQVTFPVPGQASPIGYYPTLQRIFQERVQQQSAEAFARLIPLFQAYAEGGGFSQLQVDQVEQSYLEARSRILLLQTSYADALDQFKVQLGVPTDLPLELDFSPLQPIDDQMRRYESVEKNYATALAEVSRAKTEPVSELRAVIGKVLSSAEVFKDLPLQREIQDQWILWQYQSRNYDRPAALILEIGQLPLNAPLHPLTMPPGLLVALERPSLTVQRLRALLAEREGLEDEIERTRERNQPVSAEMQARMQRINLDIEIGRLEQALLDFERQPWRAEIDERSRQRIRQNRLSQVVNSFSILLLEARTLRLRQLKEGWPKLPAVLLHGHDLLKINEDDAQKLVGEVALINRLDLMNERARVVDAWREIAVSANALLGTFNVRYNMEILTPPLEAKPLDFEGSRSRHRLFFNTELPLVRKLERNAYRATLINYQRQRRRLMAAEDRTLFQVRQGIRQLRQLAENYEIQKRALELAYLQIDNALETLQATPDPGSGRDAATAAAALTQQLLSAQRSLPQAQSELMSAWVNFVTTRMELYRDLELMQVDSRGVWIDEFNNANYPADRIHDPDCNQREPSLGVVDGPAGSERHP